jgi:hypothetical protein
VDSLTVPVSRDLKCIFVHIPRTGGTSIEVALNMFSNWRVENINLMFGLISSSELKVHVGLTSFLQHLTARELKYLLPSEFPIFYRFTFVRNPWDRMVSIYSRMDPNMLMRAREVGLDLSNVSFNQFLERTEEFSHIHLVPQCAFIFNACGICEIDFIGRYERLADDFRAVCARLGVNRSLSRVNVTNRKDYHDYYSDITRKIVERRYKEDIEKFNYCF